MDRFQNTADKPYQVNRRPYGLPTEIRLTQFNVLKFLRENGPKSTRSLCFQLDALSGRIDSPCKVIRACNGLARKGLVRYTEAETWEAIPAPLTKPQT